MMLARKPKLEDRKQKLFFILSLCLSCVFYFLSSEKSFAAVISGKDLANHIEDYDGKRIEFEGEVIGDIMPRGEFAWVNIRDTSDFAIGVWLLTSLARDIQTTGNFKFKGDTVKIKGIFYKNCPIHDSELDIHADSLAIKSKGYPVIRLMRQKEILQIIFLGAIALCLNILIGLKQKQKA